MPTYTCPLCEKHAAGSLGRTGPSHSSSGQGADRAYGPGARGQGADRAYGPGARGQGSDSAEAEMSDWVQCDRCGKWRVVEAGAVSADASWFCEMNADHAHASCGVPEESFEPEEEEEEAGQAADARADVAPPACAPPARCLKADLCTRGFHHSGKCSTTALSPPAAFERRRRTHARTSSKAGMVRLAGLVMKLTSADKTSMGSNMSSSMGSRMGSSTGSSMGNGGMGNSPMMVSGGVANGGKCVEEAGENAQACRACTICGDVRQLLLCRGARGVSLTGRSMGLEPQPSPQTQTLPLPLAITPSLALALALLLTLLGRCGL